MRASSGPPAVHFQRQQAEHWPMHFSGSVLSIGSSGTLPSGVNVPTTIQETILPAYNEGRLLQSSNMSGSFRNLMWSPDIKNNV